MSLALYRRYRPETFEEVIGQEHVTQPLQRALSNQRVNHAYLFSGPRGCGKTTSARILARCLNCDQGPTPTPCGTCKSCTDLARGGPGSIDVIEIDAASHGGVDDARDLRERAFFAPVSARYKIYILDEAHMVSPAGFNALLKVVEEPPPHLKFIFATTEPEKVIGTIRSRTHHYPFRLVPPGVLRDYLAEVCERESVPVDPDVLPLVVRAGAGSVRDSMSVLDQLLAGAGEDGVTYRMAVGLLGYTDAALLDEAVTAFAARDGAAAFQAVDHVVEGGHDPRRFLADLLERLRDLVILAAVPDAADKGLISAPGDQLARMREQAAAFGPAELSRAADLVNAGLLEMRGATAARLLLELVCARVLLPSADDSVRGVAARLDRLERGATLSGFNDVSAVVAQRGGMPADRPRTAEPQGPSMPAVPPAMAAGAVDLGTGNTATAGQAHAYDAPVGQPQQAAVTQEATLTPPWRKNGMAAAAATAAAGEGDGPSQAETSRGAPQQGTASRGVMTQNPVSGQTRPATGARPQSSAGLTEAASVRQLWPQVLEAVARRSKVAWVMLQSVHVVGVEGRLLQLGFSNPGLRDNFHGSNREETLREALRELTGIEWKIDALVDPSAGTSMAGAGAGAGAGVGPLPSAALPPAAVPQASAPVSAGQQATPPGRAPGPGADQSAPNVAAFAAAPPPFAQPATAPEDDEPGPDDEDVDDAGPTARDLLMRELGATVLEERSDAD
ncbi:DNA polymerase III subunit gamma and tau [Actinocrinis puniceicyclus]|uniref:DNA polymerase III subunit gamma/tau n=1 Tax=Actinocrinis puniceicyclus TaxID=977794 RepID=A0A8J7WNK3_9ACTN|nr:DNA polymerase III subunit gamma and tau [Actinocrinis puniceicyclus]MBS2962730.1 DNA polymerase III subunit gamma and tau [Actinocrinis puniceicyclus]